MADELGRVDGHHKDYAKARMRFDKLVGSRRSDIQQRLDDEGEGLILIHEEIDGEEKMYVTKLPELIEKYCDRLEAERNSN